MAGLSPHPLFEPEWFGPDLPRKRITSILVYLDNGAPRGGPGPLFDEAAYLVREPDAASHPGRALGHFLAAADDEDLLPVPPGHPGAAPSWGAAREIAYAAAREHCRYEALRSTPRRGPWDGDADAAFVTTWSGVPLPASQADGAPLVSVVTPVRNRPAQVLEAIESVRQQTFAGWELVVVDDGSTDDTGDVLDRAAQGDERIRVLHLPPSGVSAARNAGIAAASGRWLAFLDSDNTWVPHFLQVMVAFLEENGLGAGHSVVDTMIDPGPDSPGRYLTLDADLDHLLVRNHIDLNALVVRTDLAREIDGFDEALRRWVDHDFAIRIARRTPVPRVSFRGVLYDHGFDARDRITTTESDRWEWAVLGKAHLDWDRAEAASRVPGRVSVCIATVEDWERTRVAVDAVLAADDLAHAGATGDLEVVLLDNGSRRSVGAILHELYDGDPRVRIMSRPRNLGFGIGASLAFLESTGETVVFLDNDTEVLPGWLRPLQLALDDDEVLGAQSLLLRSDGSVWSAGYAFLGGRLVPSRLLEGHPVDDALRLAPMRRTAVSGNALAMRAADVIRLRGFDPMFHNGLEDLDLCLRAGDGAAGRFRVVTESRVLHHCRALRSDRFHDSDQDNRVLFLDRWADRMPARDVDVLTQLGLEIAHLDPGAPVYRVGEVRAPKPVVVRPRSLVGSGPGAGLPRLRWSLKTGVPLRASADEPDLVAAEALAAALRSLGQDVVVDRLESNGRTTDYLDDVAVAIRGNVELIEVPGRVNLLFRLDPNLPLVDAEAGRYSAVLGLADAGGDADRAARLLVDAAATATATAPWGPPPSS